MVGFWKVPIQGVWIFKMFGVALELGSQQMLLPLLIVLWPGRMSLLQEGKLMWIRSLTGSDHRMWEGAQRPSLFWTVLILTFSHHALPLTLMELQHTIVMLEILPLMALLR